jgi:hypothetical protein
MEFFMLQQKEFLLTHTRDSEVICKRPKKKGIPSNFHEFWREVPSKNYLQKNFDV